MDFLHTLRNTPWLARLALLWFAMTLGVAVASPMVNPQEELVICTSAGMVKLKFNADGSVSSTISAQAQCPLCVVGGAPPSFARLVIAPVPAPGPVLQGIAATPIAVASAAPPPSRGPPSPL